MKKIFNLRFLLLVTLVAFMTSCQKEEEEFIDNTDPDTITADSVLTNLLRSASQNEGSGDDIIDGSSCLSLVYPVEVIANGQTVILESEADIAIVQAIFDQFPNDQDTLEIVFPIIVSLEDFTQITVSSQSELDDLIAACDDTVTNDFACVDFVYPITCFVYNSNNEQTGTITVNSDEEWFLYLLNLDNDTYISIDFPISVIVNGETIQVNSNQELLTTIQQADCSNNNTTIEDFETLVTSGNWYVTYFFDDYDETSDFADYEFTFASDGSAQATNTSGSTPGTWDYYTDSGEEKFDLNFGTTDPLDELEEDWIILEATQDIIRLKDVSGDGSVDYLTFERTPYTGGGGGSTNSLIEDLTTDTWFVNLLNDDGDDETCDYVEYEFTFNSNGTVQAVSPSNTKDGFWAVNSSSSGLDLVLNFSITGEDDPFDDLNDDWDVTSHSNELIELIDISGGNGGTDYLNFGRNPYTGCSGGGGGSQALNDILLNGPWYVATYLDDGNDETNDYNGYNVTFTEGGSVTATNGSNTINGTWAITGSSDLDLVLDFGTQIPFDEFNDDWDVLNYNDTTITLQDVSGGGGGTDTLIFEKL